LSLEKKWTECTILACPVQVIDDCQQAIAGLDDVTSTAGQADNPDTEALVGGLKLLQGVLGEMDRHADSALVAKRVRQLTGIRSIALRASV
jgi:flagellar basal body rod protein FlgF